MRPYSKEERWFILIGAFLTLGGLLCLCTELLYCAWVGPTGFNHRHAFALSILFIVAMVFGQMFLYTVKEDD